MIWPDLDDHAGVVGRGELTDVAWARIEPRQRTRGGRGRQWRDHRQVINGEPVEAAHRRSVAGPARTHGPWKTAHERLRVWTADGTWDRFLDHVIVKDD